MNTIFGKTYSVPKKVINDPARYSVSLGNGVLHKDVAIRMDAFGDIELSSFGSFDFDNGKSVGYLFHDGYQISDMDAAKAKPWLPAISPDGTTLSDLINECGKNASFKTVCRNGKVTVHLPFYCKLIGDIYYKNPCKYYRTIFDGSNFAVKIVTDRVAKAEGISCRVLDRTIKYTNSPSKIFAAIALMGDEQYSKENSIQILVNNGRGTFYKLYNPRIK